MTKHKTEDYNISAVKYYLNNDKGDGYKKTCKIFDCKNIYFARLDTILLLRIQNPESLFYSSFLSFVESSKREIVFHILLLIS